jgi:hypothetical protein
MSGYNAPSNRELVKLFPNSYSDKWTRIRFTGFELLTAAVVKSFFFWDITPCSPLKVDRSSEGKYLLHLSFACCLLHACLFSWLTLQTSRWKRHFVRMKRRLMFDGLYGYIFQEIKLFTRSVFNISEKLCVTSYVSDYNNSVI